MSDRHSVKKITQLGIEMGRMQVQAELRENHIKQLTERNEQLQEQAQAQTRDVQTLRNELATKAKDAAK